ncbi:MAG: DUF3021 family protein [Lachnospiraceae bacterium]|nr:DUF3021 family protein [Lachnospiraceae bacterium]
MDLKDFVKFLIRQYFVIYTGSMIATFCFCMAFYPEDSLPVSYPAWMLLFSLCGTLPGAVFYSKNELTKKQWYIRRVIHVVLLEAVLLVAGNILGMYEGLSGGFWFAITVLAVYVFVNFITFWMDQKTAEELNKKLKERRERFK